MQSSTATSTTLAASVGTITLGDTVTFTATVTASTGTPTGLVTFFDGNTPLGSGTLTIVAGQSQASFSTSLLSAAGSPHSITAIYQGDATHTGSTSSATSETVNSRTSTTGVVLNPTSVVVGQPSTATVTLTDSGSVPPGTADTFTTTGAPATGRTGFTSTLFADGLVLVAAGTDANNNVLNSAEIYSVSGAAFTATGNLNTARTGAVAVLLPTGKVLVAGGSSDGTAAGALNSAEVFDPSAGTFTTSSNNMTAARFGATATLLNTGKVLIAGGENSGGVLNSAELYDPVADTFTSTGNLNSARTGASATLLGTGKVLIAGGSSDGTANGALNSAELFDPAGNSGAGTFTSVAGANPTLETGRWEPEAALLLSGKVLIAGGQNSGGALASADLYDPVADSFTPSNQSMSQARANGSAVSLPSGMVLLAGGTTSQAVDLYDADSDKFDTTGSLQQSDSGLVATLLNNGDVLVVGLTTAATPASDAELYSPSFNPLGTVGLSSSEATDSFGAACVLSPGASTASTCTSTVTPANVATSPHTITGTYPTDAVHSTSNSTANLTVNPAATTTNVASSLNPSIFGQPVSFTATVTDSSTGSTAVPTGSVQFVVDGVNFGSPVTLTGVSSNSSTATSQARATLSVAGSPHTVTANYVDADGNFTSSSGTLAGGQTVMAASTTTTVQSSQNPSTFGQSVTFTATVTDNAAGSIAIPTGSVQFVVDGVNFGSPVALTGATSNSSTATSQATATLSVAGSPHTVTANYVNADGNFVGGSGTLTGGQVVNVATTSTTVASSLNPSIFGQSVTFTATVTNNSTSSAPTGAVQFVVDGVNFGSPVAVTPGTGNTSTATSQATSTLSVAGSPHAVTANYVNADGNFSNSTGALTGGQTVTAANTTTTVTSSQAAITLGDTVTFTATVTVTGSGTGTPTGLVTFFDGTTPLGSGTLNQASPNQATFSTSLLAVGSHSITAIYDGDANFTASPLSSAITETVNLRASATGVVLNPTTVVVGQPSTVTVTVTDSGSVPPGTADTFSPTGATATSRTGFTSTLFGDGLVLVAGGTGADGTTVLQSAEIYSVTGAAFTATGNLNTARTGAVAVLLPNGQVLLAGGSSDGTATGALNTAELFNPAAGTFTVAGAGSSNQMTAARFGTTATLLNNGKVLLAGGENSGGVLNSAELYDPVADTFTVTGNLNTARTGASATLLGTGKVLIAGGSGDGTGNGALNSGEVFDPAGNSGAGTFTAITGANSTLSDARWQPEAALLLSGKVLIAGGQNSGGPLNTADLYDPVANNFTATAHTMAQARTNGSAVALPNGMVLLAGGTTSQVAELYDAESDKFDTTGSLQQSDNGLVATLLNNGEVLAVGLTTAATPASDAELNSPSFNPLGTVGLSSSEATDGFGAACVLSPSTSTASTCTSTVTPANVATSPHTITGTYPADAVHSGRSNTASLTVNKDNTTTTITAHTPNPSVVNQPVTISVSVTANAPGAGTPTGSVIVSDGAGETCTIASLSSGSGSCSLTPQVSGTDTLTATYNGDANFNGSTSAGVSHTVSTRHTTTTVVLNPSTVVVNQASTVTVTVTDDDPNGTAESPTGMVAVTSNSGGDASTDTITGSPCTLVLTATTGISTCQVTVRPHGKGSGTHTITASYSGSNVHSASTGSAMLTVNTRHTSTTASFNPNPVVVNQTSTATITVTDDDLDNADKLSPAGTVIVTSDSGGDASADTITGVCTLSSTATGVSTCTVTVRAHGKGSGTHNFTASYPGSDVHTASTSPLTPLTVNTRHTSTTVKFSINGTSVTSAKIATPVTVTVTVTDDDGNGSPLTPQGTITTLASNVNSDSVSSSTCTLNAPASNTNSCSITFSAPHVATNPHTISAGFLQDDQHTNSSAVPANSGITVQPADTASAIASGTSLRPSTTFTGQQVTFSATVSNADSGSMAAPIGSMQFLVDGNVIGSAPVAPNTGAFSSSASFTATLSQIGAIPGSSPVAHSVTVSFQPDADFVSSTSADSIDIILAPSITNIPGQTIAPIQLPFAGTGTTGNVNFNCTVLLLTASTASSNSPQCTVNPLSGPAQTTVTVNLITVPAPSSKVISAPSIQASNRPPGAFYALSTPLGAVLGILLLGGSRRKRWSRRKLLGLLGMMLLLSVLVIVVGCGGGFNNPTNLQPLGNGTAPGQYVISVIGTDSNGNVVGVATMQLTVQI